MTKKQKSSTMDTRVPSWILTPVLLWMQFSAALVMLHLAYEDLKSDR